MIKHVRRTLTAALAVTALTGAVGHMIQQSPSIQQSPLAIRGHDSATPCTTAMFPSLTCPSTQQIQVAKAKPQATQQIQVAGAGGFGGGGFFTAPSTQQIQVALGGGWGGGCFDCFTSPADKAKV